MDDAVSVRAGEDLDWDRLDRYLRTALPWLQGELSVAQFPHGSANLTYRLRVGDTDLVLRRPPFGELAPGAHDMRREYSVLSRLSAVFDRAPAAYLLCQDHSVVGADFVVMERRHGVVVRGELDPEMAAQPDVAARLTQALVDALAELHGISPEAAGLESLGRPAGFLSRQVAGWRARWERVRPAAPPPEMDIVPERLARSIPEPQRVSIVHNDYKLDNCQFQPPDPDRVTSIFDWDMATLGDPLIDLGTLLNYWPDPADPPQVRRAPHPGLRAMGLPSRAQLTHLYGQATGLDMAPIAWYEAFAQWKTAVVLQQLYKRWADGDSADSRMASMGDDVVILARSAAELLVRLWLVTGAC